MCVVELIMAGTSLIGSTAVGGMAAGAGAGAAGAFNAAAGLSVLQGVASVAAGGFSLYQQIATNQANEAAHMAFARQNAANARMSFNQQVAADQAFLLEKQEEMSGKATAVARQAAEAKATAITASSQMGSYGASLQSLLADMDRQSGEYKSATDRNNQLLRGQLARRGQGFRAQADGQAQSVGPFVPRPIDMPNLFAPLSAIGGIQDAYSRFIAPDLARQKSVGPIQTQ